MTREDYAALQAAIDNPPEPNDALIALMRTAYSKILAEPVPDDFTALLESLQ